ncbi:hypothetical protein [Cerasicoccus frondis]|uniref:hypothetical protein n=1 Tax=Cerasicoccus frondis TaxID=490090 RepID=UPI002852908F|nr:hypothetical protein [Cerasicoccus frondis]
MIPDGKLLSIKELAAEENLPCEKTIRKWRKEGAPFWGYRSTVNDLLKWQFERTAVCIEDTD